MLRSIRAFPLASPEKPDYSQVIMNDIETIRRFNRMVTRTIGVFGGSYLGRPRPLGASRILYEMGRDGADLRGLRDRLGLDSGYLSRLLRVLEREGLVRVVTASQDARLRRAVPTDRGLEELELLDRLSDDSAGELLEEVPPRKRTQLLDAMQTVERLLAARAIEVGQTDVNDPRSQTALQAYYAELADRFPGGFDPGNDAEGREFIPPSGSFLLATLYGLPVGCGAICFHADFAEIRRMWVHVDHRGCGVASRILEILEEKAIGRGYRIVRLDTNGSLAAAQALYEHAGYRKIERYNKNPYAELWYEKPLEGR